MKVIHARLGDTWVQWEYVGQTMTGADVVLLDGDDDLSRGLPWASTGFSIAPFLDEKELELIRAGITSTVRRHLELLGVPVPADFTLERYHEVVDGEVHARLMKTMKSCPPLAEYPGSVARLEARMSELLGTAVVVHRHPEAPPCFCFRIVRPQSNDNNPPHRDVWLDRLRNAINIYVPIVGSDANSSLPLIPGSHRWKESELERTVGGASIGGNSYTVPAVVSARKALEMVRPDPREGEVLVFSPYLVHGGAKNLNTDRTRVSLEMRFIRATDAR